MVIVGRVPHTVVIHVGSHSHGKSRDGHAIGAEKGAWRVASLVELYCRCLGKPASRPLLLLPATIKDQVGLGAGGSQPLWYDDENPLDIPIAGRRGHVVLINGNRLPIVDWSAARSAVRRYESDVVVFGAHGLTDRGTYDESVEVNELGEVIRFRRHYHDSPMQTDLSSDEACFLSVSARHATRVVRHIVARGWGLESIGALTRQFSVRWSESPCVRGALLTASTHSLPESDGAPLLGFAVESNGKSDGLSRKASRNGRSSGGSQAKHGVAFPERIRALVSAAPAKPAWGNRFCKRAMDIVISLGVLTLLFVPLLFVAWLIKVTSRGPVFFAHPRQGRGGKEFKCIKFRTMVKEADDQQAALRQKNEVDGPQFKIEHDPRLTPIGGWLRRFNIDEIPQFMNVLLGQMSLVGPRPSPDRENQNCPAWRRARLSVRPGITGLWQVLRLRSPRASDFQEWIYYDIEYVRHCSLWLDCLLLLYTPVSMFRSRWLVGLARRLERRGICKHSPRLDAAA